MDTIVSSSSSPRRRSRTMPFTLPVKASAHLSTAGKDAGGASFPSSPVPSAAGSTIAVQVLDRATRMHRDLEQILEIMGWQAVPTDLISDIMDDLSSFADELKGAYSTVCPYVIRRRQSIDFWIRSVMDGTCSVGTAREALRVTRPGSTA